MRDFIVCFLLQSLLFVGGIFLFGYLIGLCNRRFYANFGRHGRAVSVLTGLIGTPVHEGAHALACLLFGHRIVEVRLFSLDPDDGVLGYVRHSYNPKSFYQRLGNFFIGTAPIVVISLFLAFVAYLVLPEMFFDVRDELFSADFSDGFFPALGAFVRGFGAIFSYAGEGRWWILLAVGMLFCLHMSLSRQDVKGALGGLLFLLLLFAAADAVLRLLGRELLFVFTGYFLAAAGFMNYFLAISLLLSLCSLLLSFLFRPLCRR